MLLRDAIANPDSLPDAATLFAERIDGHFRAEASALLHELTEQEIRLPIREVAAKAAPRLDYFLEVDVAREVVEGLKANHSNVAPCHRSLTGQRWTVAVPKCLPQSGHSQPAVN